MTNSELIIELEKTGSRAWPAREEVALYGWILRADMGITRRANSVLPTRFEGSSLERAIEEAARFYTKRGLPIYYQMTEASQPQELDDVLESMGYERELTVHVQTIETSKTRSAKTEAKSSVTPTPDKEWMRGYTQATGYSEQSIHARLKIMERVRDHKGYALAKVDGTPAAVGFGVVTGEWVGLFGIATRKEFRRRGAATAVSKALISWGESVGARQAYLQVETDNIPAIKLYEQMGFATVYTYWYRLLKNSEDGSLTK
ncbi:MAG: GNAT family N-acetyltransferase [Candidatus Thorarchaeota archaeon]|nr:GNAT family N-acetyltransferase [Candidatus Thorarchaeota archaeon]